MKLRIRDMRYCPLCGRVFQIRPTAGRTFCLCGAHLWGWGVNLGKRPQTLPREVYASRVDGADDVEKLTQKHELWILRGGLIRQLEDGRYPSTVSNRKESCR